MQQVTKETLTQQTADGSSTVAQVSTTDTQTQTAANIIYFIAGVLEITLLFRFIFRITGANPGSGFVSGIYGFTQFLILPFRGIFSPAASEGIEVRSIFEPATLIAMIVYAIIAWGAVRLIAIVSGHSSEEL
jgi:hypothetical protein